LSSEGKPEDSPEKGYKRLGLAGIREASMDEDPHSTLATKGAIGSGLWGCAPGLREKE
jgi:hypothetical protein